ncbi:MAG: hypothetical protein QOE82_751 [Thermoanaerobaculia bacterium]|jgi:hypothetical protein|nr:hypothetical protein [Thermoanaerobaculia bacterium]
MLRVRSAGTESSLIDQPVTRARLIAGIFATAFGLVMLLHPHGWTNGTMRDGIKQMADPNLIRAIGTAIFVFGFLLLFLRVSYLVNRSAGSLTEQWRLIVPIRSSDYSLNDFSDLTILSDTPGGSRTRFRLCLVSPARTICLASSYYPSELKPGRNLIANTTGIGKDRPRSPASRANAAHG